MRTELHVEVSKYYLIDIDWIEHIKLELSKASLWVFGTRAYVLKVVLEKFHRYIYVISTLFFSQTRKLESTTKGFPNLSNIYGIFDVRKQFPKVIPLSFSPLSSFSLLPLSSCSKKDVKTLLSGHHLIGEPTSKSIMSANSH